jgi:Fur family zinc uptake transcriptional regulator
MNHLSIDLYAKRGITLTPLRKEILLILHNQKRPIGAYEILAIIKKTYPATKAPSVYRVLNFLVKKNLVHRIDSCNAYVYCASWMEQNKHQTILLLCSRCHQTTEFIDNNLYASLSLFSHRHNIQIEDSLIELKGICYGCRKKGVT